MLVHGRPRRQLRAIDARAYSKPLRDKEGFSDKNVEARGEAAFTLASCHYTIGSSVTGVILLVQRLKPGTRNRRIASKLSASTM